MGQKAPFLEPRKKRRQVEFPGCRESRGWRSAATRKVDALVERRARVRVVDDLSSGKLENISGHIRAGRVEFVEADLRQARVAEEAVQGRGVVFYLAADHSGRGYVDLHQAACATNLMLDLLPVLKMRTFFVGRTSSPR